MSTQAIIVETRGRVGVIRMNRPQALNALNATLNGELLAAAEAFEADAGIGCILITGSDKAFAAGADIKEMADRSYIDVFGTDFAADWERLTRLRKPLVAAVKGVAVGIGATILLNCDAVFVAEDARLSTPFVSLALAPEAASTFLLPIFPS